jgi:hypothetical protein
MEADNGVDAPIVRTFVIGVVNVDENPPLDFIWYGQSNELNHIFVSSSPPAANAGTLLWDSVTSAWITPASNRMRTFLNAMQASTGRVCRAVYGGQSGVSIATLLKGQANYSALISRINASGINDAEISDGVHWTGASYGRSGARYARTVQVLMGLQTARPLWFATAVERVNETQTRIMTVHSTGSDSTPGSGITGAEISNDNGTTWVSATGAREDADDIILTHSGLGTGERPVRYQFGKTPNVSAPARDNRKLAVPLNFTIANLVAPGAVALPTITYSTSMNAATSGASQSRTGIDHSCRQ